MTLHGVKIKSLFLLAGLMINHTSQAAELADCTSAAQKLGVSETAKSLTKNCSNFIFDRAPASQISDSQNGGYSVAGYKNVISIHSNKNLNHYDFIAGSCTGLHEIQSVSLASKQRKIWTLNNNIDGKSEIRVFDSKNGGDLIPNRVYKDESLVGASFLQVSKNESEIAVWFPEVSEIKIFSTETADVMNMGNLKIEWKRKIKFVFPQHSKIDSFLWVSDMKKIIFSINDLNQILTFQEPTTTDEDNTAKLKKQETLSQTGTSIRRTYWNEKLKKHIVLYRNGTTLPLGTDP